MSSVISSSGPGAYHIPLDHGVPQSRDETLSELAFLDREYDTNYYQEYLDKFRENTHHPDLSASLPEDPPPVVSPQNGPVTGCPDMWEIIARQSAEDDVDYFELWDQNEPTTFEQQYQGNPFYRPQNPLYSVPPVNNPDVGRVSRGGKVRVAAKNYEPSANSQVVSDNMQFVPEDWQEVESNEEADASGDDYEEDEDEDEDGDGDGDDEDSENDDDFPDPSDNSRSRKVTRPPTRPTRTQRTSTTTQPTGSSSSTTRTNTSSKPSAWSAEEDQACVNLMVDIINKPKYASIRETEERFAVISKRMRTEHGFQRSQNSVKFQWNRRLRAASGLDERGDRKRSDGLTTSSLKKSKRSSNSNDNNSSSSNSSSRNASATSSSSSGTNQAAPKKRTYIEISDDEDDIPLALLAKKPRRSSPTQDVEEDEDEDKDDEEDDDEDNHETELSRQRQEQVDQDEALARQLQAEMYRGPRVRRGRGCN